MRLTLGLGETFIGIDLRNRDLSGFYLATKNFSGAKFDGADLRGTNLSGANLSFATLTGADLRGAKLSATQLTPSEYLAPGEGLTPGSISFGGKPLADAITQGITIRGAKYDSSTEWPEGFEPSKGGAVFVD